MTPVDALGWFASALLIATVSRQVWKQHRDRCIEGVSRWLFLGQMATALAFLAYSWMRQTWIFVVSNAFLFCAAVVGELLRRRIAREQAEAGSAPTRDPDAARR